MKRRHPTTGDTRIGRHIKHWKRQACMKRLSEQGRTYAMEQCAGAYSDTEPGYSRSETR